MCGRSALEVANSLDAYLANGAAERLRIGSQPAGGAPKLAFLFGDHVGPLGDMAPTLAEMYQVFRSALEECATLADSDRTETSLFVLQTALFALWKDWGVRPQAVLGQGTGVFAAACAAGALAIPEGFRLAAAYARLAPGAAGQDELQRLTGGLDWRRPRLQWVCGRTGALLSPDKDAGRSVQTPTRIAAGLWAIEKMGCDHLLEVGPNKQASGAGPQNVKRLPFPESGDARTYVCETLAHLYSAGVSPEWDAGNRAGLRRKVALPTYSFQRQIFWSAAMPAVATQGDAPDVVPAKTLRVDWRPAPLGEARRDLEGVVLLARDMAQADAASEAFAAEGLAVEILLEAGVTKDGAALVQSKLHEKPAALAKLIGARALLDIRFAEGGGVADEISGPARAALPVLQALPQNGAEYWLATRGAFAVRPRQGARAASAALWGLGLSLRAERPELNIGLVDLDPAESNAQWGALVHELQAGDIATAPIAWRGGVRLERVMVPVSEIATNAPKLRDDAYYLVTGGLGGVRTAADPLACGTRRALDHRDQPRGRRG